jgi:hypothetical protein
MKIYPVNVDENLIMELSKLTEISQDFESSDSIFINWLPKNVDETEKLLEQSNYIELATKSDKKALIFDEFFSLNKKEVQWLLKYKNVTLSEPVMRYRKGFDYIPKWIKKYSFSIETKDKIIDLGYVGTLDNKKKEYDFYYEKYQIEFPERIISKNEKDFSKVKSTVLLGSELDYFIGNLQNLNPILNNDCIPLLPNKHRFYHSLFKELVISDINDINFIMEMSHLSYGLLEDFYDRIKKYFPEFLIENVAYKIFTTLGGK